MSVEIGTICPGCLTQARSMLLFEVAPNRRVCGECFAKVRTQFPIATAEVIARTALLDIVNADNLKAWALRDIAATALDALDALRPSERQT
jgi:hypothetical protein